jgi:hypothetical protein
MSSTFPLKAAIEILQVDNAKIYQIQLKIQRQYYNVPTIILLINSKYSLYMASRDLCVGLGPAWRYGTLWQGMASPAIPHCTMALVKCSVVNASDSYRCGIQWCKVNLPGVQLGLLSK